MTEWPRGGHYEWLRIDYGDPREPDNPVAWLWRFIVCRVGVMPNRAAVANLRLS
jgi:hypothetical protein